MVESLFLGLGTVSTAHGKDLCPKSILDLSYDNVVAVLLNLIPLLLSFNLVLLSLYFGIFSQFLKFISLL